MADDELVDALDDNGTPIGVVTRAEAHQRGIWHRAFHCWIVAEEDARRYLLFQRRSPSKTLYPDRLDVTAAGHMLAGETPADGLRELMEEVGVVAQFSDLIPLGRRQECRHVGTMLDREFADVFLLRYDLPLETYRLQADEVVAICRLELGDGLRLWSGEVDDVMLSGMKLDAKQRLVPFANRVTRDDFFPRYDKYYLKVCIMAERFFQSSRYLAI